MPTVKRLYLYGVLAVVGIPLLVGLADIMRLLLESLFEAAGVSLLNSARLDREDVSLAFALVLVGTPLWGVHAWLLRRSSSGSAAERAEELASVPRASYFLVVLVATLAVSLSNASEVLAALFRSFTLGQRVYELPGEMASVIVFGSAWLVHVAWRRRDLRLEPARTARDWSTRLYLYGVLFVVATVALLTASESLSVVARELSGMRPMFEGPRWWQDAIAGPLALAVAATVAWLLHMGIGDRLTRAPSPMGEAHRESRSRIAYLLGIALLCAIAVLISLSAASRHILNGTLGIWESVEGSRFEEEAYGPLVGVLPFLAAWWFHLRRASLEALAFGGSTQQASVVRAGRLVVAFVGLVGLSLGVAWGIGASIDLAAEFGAAGAISESALRDSGTLGLSAALVGLVMWLPSWRRLQRERAGDPVGVAASTARRAYLLLVSGVAVVAAMACLSWLVYQVIRVVVEAGQAEDSAWVFGALLVAAVVLSYHLVALRTDLAIVAATGTTSPATPTPAGGAVEELEISGPPDADFEALNASVRSQLPEGLPAARRAQGRGSLRVPGEVGPGGRHRTTVRRWCAVRKQRRCSATLSRDRPARTFSCRPAADLNHLDRSTAPPIARTAGPCRPEADDATSCRHAARQRPGWPGEPAAL